MITLAIIGAVVILLAGAGAAWYLESRTAMLAAAAIASAAVAARVCFRSTHKAATNIPPSVISAADQLQRVWRGLAYVCDCELIGAVKEDKRRAAWASIVTPSCKVGGPASENLALHHACRRAKGPGLAWTSERPVSSPGAG